MEFFPLKLGIAKPRAKREEEQERRRVAPTHEVWREGFSGPEEAFDPHPAERLDLQ